MASAPKCLPCLKAGKIAQTYKVTGKNKYRCRDCKTIYDGKDFDPIEFTWKENFAAYRGWLESQGIKIKDMFKGNL